MWILDLCQDHACNSYLENVNHNSDSCNDLDCQIALSNFTYCYDK